MTLAGFPRRTLRGDRALYRIHRADRAPWWFSADGAGRFDPPSAGEGACYFAEAPLGAWVAVFRRQILLDDAELRVRALTPVTLGRNLRLADLTSRRALQFGVTASLGADEHYTDSQAFAARAWAAGFAGIRYHLRHDPAQTLHAVALFGPAATSQPPPGAHAHTGPIPGELIDQARARFGYRIVPRP